MLKQKLQIAGWGALGLCCVVLLVAAMKTKDHKTCAGIRVDIKGAVENIFVNENDIKTVLKQNNIIKGEDISGLNLRTVEDQLEKNAWIKDAELYFDNKQVLYATIREREPIARVFTIPGNSFYIDSSTKRLPLSEASVARIPVFTGFPSDNKHLSLPDSVMLLGVRNIARYIINDSFWNAQTAQINIATDGSYQLIPVIGNQVIEIGDAENLDEKFQKLFCFYQQVWSKVGFEKYETISIQYSGQVVAVRRGAAKPLTDTGSAIQHLMNSDRKLAVAINDTATSVMLTKSNTTVKPAGIKTSAVKNDTKAKAVVTDKKENAGTKKIVVAKPDKKANDAAKPKPKAVMKKPGGH